MTKLAEVEFCGHCPNFQHWNNKCKLADKYLDNLKMPSWCPLPSKEETK